MPERAERAWVHPSELPNFDKIPVFDASVRYRNRTPAFLVAGLSFLVIGAIALALNSTTQPATSALHDHIAASVDQLPGYAQAAARSSIELVITTDSGHVSSAAAMVIQPGDLAVTTEPIPEDASITGSSASNHRFNVVLVTHDPLLGFSVVRLGVSQQVTPTGVLPASSSVLAISPYFSLNAASPEFAWAETVLGDPVVEQRDNIVSYLSTPSAANLRGFVDTLAIDGSGNVVAVLSANSAWYSAAYVTKVAQVITANGGCHGRLGIVGESAQGGGVVVLKVEKGPARGHLHRGDVLSEANGVPIDSLDTLLSYLYASTSHEGVVFKVQRASHSLNVGVVLGCQP